MTFACFLINIDQIVLHPLDASLVGDRAMAGDYHFYIQSQNSVAGFDPVAHGTRPCDRSPIDEQNVAGVNDPIGGDEGDHIAGCMRGSYLDEIHLLVANLEYFLSSKGSVGQPECNSGEIECSEDFLE